MTLRRRGLMLGTLALTLAFGASALHLLAPRSSIETETGTTSSPSPLPSSAAVLATAQVTESPATPPHRQKPPPATSRETSTETVARLTAEIGDAFDSLSVARLDLALTQLLPALVRENPAAAAELAESLSEPDLRGEVMYLVARLWGKMDAEAAIAWAGRLKIEYERDAALTDAGAELARENPARALELSAPFYRTDQPSPVLENLVQQWAEKNPPAALAWTLAHHAGPQRDELLARIAWLEAQRNPATAAQLVAAEIRPGERQEEAVISVLHQWAKRDPSAALAWTARFPAGTLRERALTELSTVASLRRLTAAP